MSQLDFGDYAGQPAYRQSDPDTSVQAGLAGKRARSKRAVLRTLAAHGPMHDERLADLLPHLPRGSAGKRRLDLVRMKLVEQVTLHGQPVYARTTSNSNALVWGLTARGRFVAERLPVEDDTAPPVKSQETDTERVRRARIADLLAYLERHVADEDLPYIDELRGLIQ